MKFNFFQLPIFDDKRGKLMSLEFREQVPFKPVRLYSVFENKEMRGGHAHEEEQELFLCEKGSFTAKIHDGTDWHVFFMKPGDALYTNVMVWHEFYDFSKDALMLALSSTPYDKDRKGYIIDFEKFLKICKSV